MDIIRLNWKEEDYPKDLLERFQKEKHGYWKINSDKIKKNQKFLLYSIKSSHIQGIIGFGEFARDGSHLPGKEEIKKYRLDLVKKKPKTKFAEINLFCLNLDSPLITLEEIAQRFGELGNFTQQGSKAIEQNSQPEASRLYQELNIKYNAEAIEKEVSELERKLKQSSSLSTEAIRETVQRVGQKWLRDKLIYLRNSTCQISGECNRELLVCSHIVPWRVDTKNRLNLNNVLLLAFNYDFLFDKGYISFNDDGTIIVSDEIKGKFGIRTDLKLKGLNEESKKFLKRHRENIFGKKLQQR